MQKLKYYFLLFKMSLRFKPVCENFTTPTINPDYSYTFYSAENVSIPVDNTVKVSTGIMISIPDRYFPWLIGDKLEISRNITVSMNTSLSLFTNNSNENIKEFVVQLTNNGCSDYDLRIGEPICKMVLLKTGRFIVEQVNTFKQTIKVPEPEPVADKIPKIVALWFKREYKSNPDKFLQTIFDHNQLENLRVFKLSEKYINARIKINVEVNYIWDNLLTDKLKHVLYDMYKQSRDQSDSEKSEKEKSDSENEVDEDE